MNNKYLFTSESVTEGNPDKIADQISDAILDDIINKDPYGRVAVETMVATGLVMVAGQITTSCYVDIPQIVRRTIREIGYTRAEYGFDGDTCAVLTSIDEQAPDIALGVNKSYKVKEEEKGKLSKKENDIESTGAGDQGMMFGYACNETPELMPLPIMLAHKLVYRLTQLRKEKILPYLRPDGKSQVTVEYENGNPKRVEAVVIAAQHHPDIPYATLKKDIIEKVIKYIIPDKYLDSCTKYFINTTGRFIIGGPQADTGLTGRKIIVDTYGGMGRHGGGCFSGKDPTKVDRSGSYAARYVAKNIVAAGLADKCEVQIAYAIGVAHPVSIMLDTFGTEKIPQSKILELIKNNFDLRPEAIIRYLKLRRPIYKKTAAYGHFGREDEDFTWEKTDQAEILKNAAYHKKNNEEKKERYDCLEKITNRGDIQEKAETILPKVLKKWEQKHSDHIEKVEKTEVEKGAQEKVINTKATLNPKYTFDNFVVGNSNRFAHAACLAVAQSPAKVYNPLFIYGGDGLEKNHLLHSIGNYILQHDTQPKIKILHTSPKKLVKELIWCIDEYALFLLRNRYQNIDVLLFEDIQFLAGDQRAQEEFLDIFNLLYALNKQMVFTSDRPPKELIWCDNRLLPRFTRGFIIEIQPPDFEAGKAILRKKIEKEQMPEEAKAGVIKKAEKEEDIVNEKKVVKIAVNKVEVKGKITYRSAILIDIEIIEPFQNISKGLHIPYFSRPFHSFEGDYGDQTAEKLLRELYDISKYLDKNMNSLKEKLFLFKKKINQPSLDLTDQKNWGCLGSFFDNNFPMVIPYGTREGVIDILEGRKDLINH